MVLLVDEQHLYKGKKGIRTTNCMCAYDFDMKFTFECVGWEWSTYDTRIFLSCLNNESDNFPKPPVGLCANYASSTKNTLTAGRTVSNELWWADMIIIR